MHRDAQTYSSKVLMGNWMEETRLEAVDLNTACEFVKYGQDVQLVNCVTPEVRSPGSVVASGFDGGESGAGMSLSCGILGEQLYTGLGPGSPVTASRFTDPCVRNCFKFRGLRSGCEDGKFLKFGDIFAISPCVSSEPLFVTAAVPRLHTGRGTCGRPTLKLTGTLDEQCRWTVVYWDAGMQMKSEGLPVPNGCRASLKQTYTGRNVAAETDFRQSTYFGDEYEVSAHSYKGFGGRDKNIWQLIACNGRPEEPVMDNGYCDTKKE